MENNRIITWDEYFMGIALLSSLRSKDGNTKVGCCIVDKNNRVVGTGYNGMPNKCKDNEMCWNREGDGIHNKYFYVVHAEANAIINSDRIRLQNSILYTTLFPCCECAKLIVQSGICEIVYLKDKYSDTNSVQASKFILSKSDIKVRQMAGDIKNILLEF